MIADLPSGFWAGWVAVITVTSLLGLCWLVYSIYFSASDHDSGEQTVWDENLREDNNPAPMWWFWLILALLVFSLVYLMLYPGLGSYKGFLNWSQGGRLAESYALYDEEFGPQRMAIVSSELSDLRRDVSAMASARRIFNQHCAACHGLDAGGQASRFPNLRDIEWQWGSAPEQIVQSIRMGRRAAMPGWQASLGVDGVAALTDFVATLADSKSSDAVHPGAGIYATYCVACHGSAGKGNALLGAPDLTNAAWLYGGTRDAISESIGAGRAGVMPSFNNRLDDAQVRLLVAWLGAPVADQ